MAFLLPVTLWLCRHYRAYGRRVPGRPGRDRNPAALKAAVFAHADELEKHMRCMQTGSFSEPTSPAGGCILSVSAQLCSEPPECRLEGRPEKYWTGPEELGIFHTEVWLGFQVKWIHSPLGDLQAKVELKSSINCHIIELKACSSSMSIILISMPHSFVLFSI
ncbi:hypothetical protein EYF80_029850 [Liparis tanakae]|uniref:Uncharacterized protein n=1 Tax=Liparis tanakae TaxID=230148 RepID=A0A4Z2H2C6_9TELE|nr:hypothetical protein EYF80_029850 [Liparis tanakae]